MKVLIATTLTQGDHADDFAWALDGELVYPPTADCGEEACRCRRTFVGMASASSTTTALVVDRPDLSPDDLSLALIDSLSRQGFLDEGWSADNDAIVDEIWERMVTSVGALGEGTIVERHGESLVVRSSEPLMARHPSLRLGAAA